MKVIAVVPCFAEGPGWANTPVHIIYRDDNQKLCEAWLQPDEQPERLRFMFAVGRATHNALLDALGDWTP